MKHALWIEIEAIDPLGNGEQVTDFVWDDARRMLTVTYPEDARSIAERVTSLAEQVTDWDEALFKVGKHEHPHEHVKAHHEVVIWYPDYQRAGVTWRDDYPEISWTSGAESGETESAYCNTCDIELDPALLGV